MPRPVLATDGYKFSMAEAGWPLRRETFYYSHRRGGAQLVPLDLEALVRSLLPAPADADYAYLASHEYEMGGGFKAAIRDAAAVTVSALPRGSVFLPREPVVSIPASLDFPRLAEWGLEALRAAGMHVVKTTDPLAG